MTFIPMVPGRLVERTHEFEQERSPEPEYPYRDVLFTWRIQNGVEYHIARAMHKIPARLCDENPSAEGYQKAFNDAVWPLMNKHYDAIYNANRMPCSQCGGTCTKISLRLTPELHKDPPIINIGCVPVCHGKDCIYKSRMDVREGSGAFLSRETVAASISLGECWVCKTGNSKRHCKRCGLVTYCSDACEKGDEHAHQAICQPDAENEKMRNEKFKEYLRNTFTNLY